jgi:hypothetical protein
VRKTLYRVLACVMVLVFPASMMMADTATAMLTSSGAVEVNGSRVQQSTSLFSGDKIRTPSDSAAVITARGLSILVPANSVLVMADKQVDVACGAAQIQASNGMSARVGSVLLAPSEGKAKFDIVQENGGFRVLAREGVLSVSNSTVSALNPGQTMFAAAAAGCAADPMPSDDQHRGGGPIPAAGTNIGAAVLLGVAIAAAAGVIVYVTTRQGNVSRSTP